MSTPEQRIDALKGELSHLQQKLTHSRQLGMDALLPTLEADIAHLEALIAFENKQVSQIKLNKDA